MVEYAMKSRREASFFIRIWFYNEWFLFDFLEIIVQFLNGLKRCDVDEFYAIIIGTYNAKYHSSIPILLFRLTMLY